MSAEPAASRRWTPAEYLAFERSSNEKHEYANGEIFAMSGGTREHNVIGTNILGELRQALRDRPCDVYSSDLRVRIPATDLFTYPDACVVCGTPAFEDSQRDTLLNPQVIFEVLSDSTESYDRGLKFRRYRLLPSLVDYVLLSQKEVLVEHFVRQNDGAWALRELRGGDRLRLESIACDVAIDDLYLKVFAPPAAG